jgi:hypothetical protein
MTHICTPLAGRRAGAAEALATLMPLESTPYAVEFGLLRALTADHAEGEQEPR